MSRRRRYALAGACTAAAGVALLYVLASGTTAGLSADAGGLPGRGFPGKFRAVLVGAKDALGPVTGALTATLILLLASRRSGTAAVAAASIVAGTVATAIALGWILTAWEPLGPEATRALGPDYFPSGHSAAVMALALAAIVAVGDRARAPVAAAGAIAAGLVGMGNLATHAHHPTDVVAGFLIAGGWAAATTAVSPRVARIGGGHGGLGIAAALAAALLVPAVALTGYVVEQPAAEIPAGFIASAFGVTLAATAIVGLVLALVDAGRAPAVAIAARRPGAERPRAALVRAPGGPRSADPSG
jgi:membrane-associated phospholipid phosphatase